MQSIKLLSLLLLIFLKTPAFSNELILNSFEFSKGENCNTVRQDEPPGIMSKIPIQDQNDLPICWAYAGTQMLDAWKIKNNPPLEFVTAPYPLALQYKTFVGKKDFLGGESPFNLLKKINNFQKCSLNTFRDQTNIGKNNEFLSQLLNYQKQNLSKTELLSKINECLNRAGFKKQVDINALVDHLNSDNHFNNVNKIIQNLCKDEGNRFEGYPEPKNIIAIRDGGAIDGMKKMRKLIDSRLNNNSTPTTVRFCPDILRDRNIITMNLDGRIDQSKCKSDIHFSPIVGRRVSIYTSPKTGRKIPFCQYLLRDSSGTSCTKYPNDPLMSPSDRCTKGQLWVDEDTLLMNSDEAMWLEDKDEM